MPYQLDEIEGDIRYEVKGDRLILKVKPEVFPELPPGGGDPGGSLDIEIIKLYDTTVPTDKNVFSSKRTLAEIKKAIQDNTVVFDKRYIRKDIDDFGEGNYEFRKNIFVVGEADLTNTLIIESIYSDIHADNFDVIGFHISAEGDAWLNKIYAKEDSMFAGNLSSPSFVSGFPAGYGWALTWRDIVNAAGVAAKKTHLELDDLTVRGILRVYEMVISQLLGENGTHLTTDMMKIKSVDLVNKIIYLDTEEGLLYNPFWTNDILMVQRFNGMPTPENDYYVTKQYEFVVEETHIGGLDDGDNRVDWIKYKNFVGDESLIAIRDTLVRVDNLTNPDRKGIIKQTSVEPGSPYMDIIYGMKTDPENSLRTRVGMLDGIITPYWGRLFGPGIMCDNAYLKGRFMLHTGEDISTKFEIMEGLFQSEIESLKIQVSAKDNYLSNASFAIDTDKWSTHNEQVIYTVNGQLLMFNQNLYANKKKVAVVGYESGKRVLRIKNSLVKQINDDLSKRPTLGLLPDGKVLVPTFYVSFKYKCIVPGLLKVGFSGQPLCISEEVAVSDAYLTKEFSGQWDGTGDFSLEFSGDIYVSFLALTSDPLSDFRLEMKTKLEQTDESIKLLGQKVDKHEGSITNLGIELNLTTESIKLYATKATVNDLESRYQASMLELTPTKINATVSEQITRVSEEAKAAAIEVANKAKAAADKGIADALAANDRLTGWAADDIISPTEKLTLKQEAKDLASDKIAILADAAKYSISTGGYTIAYNNYLGELNYHSAVNPENIAIRTTFAIYQNAYYDARQSILNQIATATKQTAQDYADNVGKTVQSSLTIQKNRIDALSGKFDVNGKLIEGAGWVTTTEGNSWYATKNLENGNTIASYINQTASDFAISASKIRLTGFVTFESFDRNLKDTVNAKQTADQVANAVTNKINSLGLGPLAYKSKVLDAMKDETIIIGGYLNTSFVKVKTIEAIEGYVGGFGIANNRIGTYSNYQNPVEGMSLYNDFIKFRSGNRAALIGSDVAPSGTNSLVARFENRDRSYSGGEAYRNTAVYILADNAYVPVAIQATGHIMLDGSVIDFKHVGFNTTTSGNALPIRQGNTFYLHSNSGYNEVFLPSKDMIYEAVGRSSPAYVKIRLTIVTSNWGPGEYYIYPSPGMSLFGIKGEALNRYVLGKNYARDIIIYITDTFYAYITS